MIGIFRDNESIFPTRTSNPERCLESRDLKCPHDLVKLIKETYKDLDSLLFIEGGHAHGACVGFHLKNGSRFLISRSMSKNGRRLMLGDRVSNSESRTGIVSRDPYDTDSKVIVRWDDIREKEDIWASELTYHVQCPKTDHKVQVSSGQIYNHKKGGVYEVVGIALHTETGEELILYKRIDLESAEIFARPRSMFEDGRFSIAK